MSEQHHIARGALVNLLAQTKKPGNLCVAMMQVCADQIAQSHGHDNASRVAATISREQAEKGRRAKGRNRA